MTKKLLGIHEKGSTHWVGDGFHVRNLFPSNGLRSEVDPFLMLDYAGPTVFGPTNQPRGVGEHPHRGFETVTIVYQGSLRHRDSGGHSGGIGPGDVQWMTAASGVVHEEKEDPEFARQGGTLEMVQLWVNLPSVHKMVTPGYQTLLNEDIPALDLDGKGRLRVIAGEWNGARGPAHTFTPIHLYDLRLDAGGEVNLDLPAGHSTAIALLKGDVVVNGTDRLNGEARLAVFDREGTRVGLEAKADSTLLVLDGEPIGEPVASYGPFVMNTQAELRQAFEDYRLGKMGHLN